MCPVSDGSEIRLWTPFVSVDMGVMIMGLNKSLLGAMLVSAVPCEP